ncbi:MAG: hypothetical protein E6G93_09275 [Alphaproteobacteria bacterium]|nr:MAG: hypothetical protein E6G93_09275 [Alphaproteobacteria bacterium]
MAGELRQPGGAAKYQAAPLAAGRHGPRPEQLGTRSGLPHHGHAPRKRGIQYAAPSRLKTDFSGILDRPVKPGDDLWRRFEIEAARQ